MTGRNGNPTCDDFAVLLADSLDGVLDAAGQRDLARHAARCSACRELQELAVEGRTHLRTEARPLAPPASLLQRILAATSGADTALSAPAPRPTSEPAEDAGLWPALRAAWDEVLAATRQPRFAMTTAMAFFSLSMLTSVTGATLDDVRALAPATLVGRASLSYHETTAGIVRYYENSHFLHALEVRLRELREVAEPAPAESRPDQESKTHG
jgi:hypothetical protein